MISISLWWRSVFEILIFAVFFYYSFLYLKGTRAYQVLKGMAILLLIFVIAKYLKLSVFTFVLSQFFGVALIAFVVLFQSELRRALATIGRTHFDMDTHNTENITEKLISAVSILKEKYIGALIILARENSLSSYIDTGVKIDSMINIELLITIFTPRTPLHDGAVIIDGDRIVAAACLLPLSQRSSFSHSLGTRHRAGIGITEETDAISIIVSEESGKISFSSAGKVSLDVDLNTLKKFLTDIFHYEEQKKKELVIKTLFQKYFSTGRKS